MTVITRLFCSMIVVAPAIVMMGGCAETALPEATGKGTINAINAMPASPTVQFLIEERALGDIDFKNSTGVQEFDDLTYNFNFEVTFLGESEPTRIASKMIDVVADINYTLVLTGSLTAPAPTVDSKPLLRLWERPEREWTDSETAFGVSIAHLSTSLGDLDVYVIPTGTASIPDIAYKLVSPSFGDRTPEIDLEAGEYEITIGQGDAILYQSYGVSFDARSSYTLTIFDADPSITGNISVRSISDTGISNELADSNFLPTLRTVHAAFGTGNIDIYANENFTAPIFSDLGFGESTGDIPVTAGAVTYTYTAVGNPGVIIDEESQLVPRGARNSTIMVGLPGSNLSRIKIIDNRRSIETHSKLRFIQAATNFDLLDLYLIEADTDINNIAPILPAMTFGVAYEFVRKLANKYDLILTLPDEKTPIATSQQLDLVAGDVLEVLILDTVDPMVAGVVITSF